jgi:hypothetical protein
VTEDPFTGWERECYASRHLTLHFAPDGRLAYMVYEMPLPPHVEQETDPRQMWLDVRDLVRRVIGDPDSVTGASENWIGSRLQAYWRPRENNACAQVEVLGRPHLGGTARVILTLSVLPEQCASVFR